ncbi:MAG: hypothetical protein J7K31_01075 [Candidatus Aenigmarchaeota archaeon]|nr:hypothetical protein [Candidatus Aenigmarchaeota archaeon]
MKLCIVGPADKKSMDIKLLKTAKNIFDSVLYASYSHISFIQTNELRITFKNSDLSRFDALLPRIPKERAMFGYFLLNSLDIYSPMKPQSFLIWSDRLLMLNILQREGLPIPKMYVVDSRESAVRLLKKGDISFPLSLKLSKKERGAMLANSEKEFKAMLDTLQSFNEPICMEEFFDSDYIQAFVIGNTVVGAVKRIPKEKQDIFHGKGEKKRIKIKPSIKELAIDAARAIKSSFALVTLVDNGRRAVVDVDLCPIWSMDTLEYDLVRYIFDRTKTREKPISRFTDFLTGIRSAVKDLLE